jgi:hypothetical protein
MKSVACLHGEDERTLRSGNGALSLAGRLKRCLRRAGGGFPPAPRPGGGKQPSNGLGQPGILSGRGIGQQAEWIKRFDEVYIRATAQAGKRKGLEGPRCARRYR